MANPFMAYAAILALQIRVIWGVWHYKDLTAGDTSNYFLKAASWVHGLQDNVVVSPLYTDFVGTIRAIFPNVYTAQMVERTTIVLVAAVLVLALARRIVGPPMGLLLAVWWVLLPPNFNVVYEVHLFSLLPILVAALIVADQPGRLARGVSFGLLVGATLLLRNELIVGTLIVGTAMLLHEMRIRRAAPKPVRPTICLRAYAIPIAAALLLAGGAYWRSFVQGTAAARAFAVKQDLNLCQVYAFNYKQRHPNRFTGNPWTQCQPLAREVFGKATPSYLDAVEANPRALAGMVTWNARVVPSGLQVALFGATATGDDPDYFPIALHRGYTWCLSILVVAILVGGLIAGRHHSRAWRKWLASRVWAVAVLGAVAVTCLYVVLVQHPRPEYMYGLTVGEILLVGVAASTILKRGGLTRFLPAAGILIVVGLLLGLSPFYRPASRPLHDAVVRLHAVRSQLANNRSVLLSNELASDMCNYLGTGHASFCQSEDWSSVRSAVGMGLALPAVLARDRVTVIYIDPNESRSPLVAPLEADPAAAGYAVAASGSSSQGRWSVLTVAAHRT